MLYNEAGRIFLSLFYLVYELTAVGSTAYTNARTKIGGLYNDGIADFILDFCDDFITFLNHSLSVNHT